MPPKPWNPLKFALIGAFVGCLFSIFVTFGEPTGTGAEATSRIIGQYVGGAVGGGVLLGIVAWVRNLILQPK